MKTRGGWCGGRTGVPAGRRGFALIEVVWVSGLLVVFTALILQQTGAMARSSARAARGAGQLSLAVKFAELFRADVRQAGEAQVAPGRDALILTVNGRTVQYRRAATGQTGTGRLERVVDGQVESGPLLQSLYFERVEQAASAPPLLRARWECTADADAPRLGAKHVPAGRMLILDTALRAEADAPAEKAK